MSKKVINSGDYSLHIIASEGGVIIVRVFDRAKTEIESAIFTDVDDNLRDYVAQFTTATKSIFNFLNTL